MFNYLGSLPVWLQALIVIVILLCLIGTIASVTFIFVHRKFKIKFGEKTIEVEDSKVENPAIEETKTP
jgi:hypothetical protein